MGIEGAPADITVEAQVKAHDADIDHEKPSKAMSELRLQRQASLAKSGVHDLRDRPMRLARNGW